MPAGDFQCNAVKVQFDLREILLPKAYAFTNSCIYVPAQNPEQVARDYLQAAKKELERQIAELRKQAKEKQLMINSKPDSVIALENKVSQMNKAIRENSAGSENFTNLFREEKQRVLFDAAEIEFGEGNAKEARRLYVKHAVNGELSELRNLSPEERKLINQFHQAANRANSSIPKKSEHEILSHLQGELNKVTEESIRDKEVIELEIKRLEARIDLTFSRVNRLAGLESQLRSNTRTLTKEMLLDILSVPVPSVTKTPDGIVTTQAVLASIGEKMSVPGKGPSFQFAAQKLGINPLLQAQGKILARSLVKKAAGGIMSASAGLVFADGNEDYGSLDQNKKCLLTSSPFLPQQN